jgi:hypothetical protein
MFTRVFERLSGDVCCIFGSQEAWHSSDATEFRGVNNFETTPFGQTVSCAFDSQRHISCRITHSPTALQISLEYLIKGRRYIFLRIAVRLSLKPAPRSKFFSVWNLLSRVSVNIKQEASLAIPLHSPRLIRSSAGVNEQTYLPLSSEALQTKLSVAYTDLYRSSISGRSHNHTMAATNDWTPTC